MAAELKDLEFLSFSQSRSRNRTVSMLSLSLLGLWDPLDAHREVRIKESGAKGEAYLGCRYL